MVIYNSLYNKSPFSNIWEVILGPSPFKNIDLRVKILKNDKVDILSIVRRGNNGTKMINL